MPVSVLKDTAEIDTATVVHAIQEKAKELLKEPDKVTAKYKIELHLGKDRSISNLKPTSGFISTWLSGSQFHGGGDEQNVFCGHEDCGRPVEPMFNIGGIIYCPHCKKESYRCVEDKKEHFNTLKSNGLPTVTVEQRAISSTEKFFRLTPPNLGRLIEKVWFQLDCNTSIYLKYHPNDIRYDSLNALRPEITKTLNTARRTRGKGIYPLDRILRDTANGAEPWKRFAAFVVA